MSQNLIIAPFLIYISIPNLKLFLFDLHNWQKNFRFTTCTKHLNQKRIGCQIWAWLKKLWIYLAFFCCNPDLKIGKNIGKSYGIKRQRRRSSKRFWPHCGCQTCVRFGRLFWAEIHEVLSRVNFQNKPWLLKQLPIFQIRFSRIDQCVA